MSVGTEEQPEDDWDQKFSRVLKVVTLVGAVSANIVVSALAVQFFLQTDVAPWQKIATEHFLASVGLTGFAIVSFGVVTFLRQVDGPLEFELWGLKFKGAAGQVVLWAFSVAVLSLCAKMLW